MGLANTNIVVIGAGVIGLSIARKLKKLGAESVTVFDQGFAGREASWSAAGMLAPFCESHESDELFNLCEQSVALYPELAAELFKETAIDVELDRSGTLYLAFTDDAESALDQRLARHHTASKLFPHEITELEPEIGPAVRAGASFPNDWQVDNRKLVRALLQSCRFHGVEIKEEFGIDTVMIEDGEAGPARSGCLETNGDLFVFAAGAWTSRLLGRDAPEVQVKPVGGQMIAFEAGPPLLKKVIFTHEVYLVPRSDGRILAGATVEDRGFTKSVTAQTVESLAAAARRVVPALMARNIAEAWCGLRPASATGLPYIGKLANTNNAFVAAGHYRNGILLAPITAEIIAREILNATGDTTADAGAVEAKIETTNAMRFPTNLRFAKTL